MFRRVEALKDMDSDAVTLVDLGNALYYVQGFRSISSMEATVVGGSVAEVNQPAMVLFSN